MQVLSDYDDIGAAYNADKIHTNLAVINSFAAKHPEVPTYFMLCPTSVGIYGDSLLPAAVINVSVEISVFPINRSESFMAEIHCSLP